MSSLKTIPKDADFRHLQDALLVRAERFFDGKKLPKPLVGAFMATPRHEFAPYFYSSKLGQWIDVSSEPIQPHLAEIYEDHPLSIHKGENGRTLSTISQPSLVLYMLDLLELKPGLSVFELGGGSGWNAAMLGRLVGPEGYVCSVEIIDTLAQRASKAVEAAGLKQVELVSGDANLVLAEKDFFQRGVFTASSWELPNCFFEHIENDGLLLMVLAIRPGTDLLCLLRKTESAFASELHFTCNFVPTTGAGERMRNEPIAVESLPIWDKGQEISWDSLKLVADEIPSFISFAELTHDCQQPFLVENPNFGYADEFSGLSVDKNENSLVLFNEETIQNTGTDASLIALRRTAKRWLKAGKPDIESLKLSIHKSQTPPQSRQDQWLVQRGECILEWCI